jgi:hypothetical protein
MTDSKSDKPVTTVPEQLKPYWFKPGQSGNPAGRPKSSKHRLSEGFLRDMADAWEAEGANAIAKVVKDKPEVFLKVAADLLPKEATLTVNHFDTMTDEQIIRRLTQISELAKPLLARMPLLTDDTGTATSRH